MDLGVNLAGIKLKNPVILASGTAGYGIELSSIIDLSRAGGLILKTVTVKPRKGNPEPRTWETAAGMLNSIGLENVGIDRLLDSVLPGVAELGLPVLASIAGETVRSYALLASRLSRVDCLCGIEVNVSCPNVEMGGKQFGEDPNAVGALTKAILENTGLPVFVKLSAAVSDIERIAEAASEAGCSGLSLINTLPGMAIDPESRRPRLGANTGGLSGPAIKPVAVKAIRDCFRVTGLPIIGGGGVYDSADAVEFMLAGAAAVSVGTATFQDPGRALQIIESLPAAVKLAGASSPPELVGAVRDCEETR